MLAVLACFVLARCAKEPVTKPVDPSAHRSEIEAWQKNRVVRLQAEDGWLSLVGLHWLQEGETQFGSAEGSKIPMPARIPARAGTFTLHDGTVVMTADPAAGLTIDGKPVATPIELRDDTAEGGPTVVSRGSIRFQIIKRGDRFGVRIKDPESDARTHFRGLESFPIDGKWRVEARFEPYDPPKKIPITNVLGMTSEEVSPGALVFRLGGTEYRLDPILEQGETDLFIIFKDPTSRDTTYQAGRYLYASPAGADGKVIVDFNRAYNPPCAFTAFATCPLPPPQNVLPIRIEAGEKRYGGHA